MLLSIRDRLLGWVGYIILGLIILVFSLWGVQSYLGSGNVPPVAEVNGVEISQNQYQNALLQRQQQVRQIYGSSVPASVFESDTFKKDVLDSLVRNTVVSGIADKRGYEISDAMLVDRIQSEPAFQENGAFSSAKYDQALQVQRQSKLGFEQSFRNNLKVDQVGSSIASTALVPAAAIKSYSGLEQQTRSLRMITISKAALLETASVSDAEIQTYYDENLALFMSPEQVKVDYVLLDDAALAASVEVNDDVLRTLYEQEPASFRSSQSRNVRHILYRLSENATPEQDASVKKTAEDLYQRLTEGGDFAELATQFSQDELSAANGGDLGEIFLGDLHPNLERAIFALEEGSYTAPVRTALGYQIAKVDGILGGEQLAFEQAKAQVEKEYRAREADVLYQDASTELVNVSYENINLRESGLDLEVQTSEWFSRQGGPGIASDPAVVTAAFADRVFNQKENSDIIDLQNGSQVVMRFVDSKAPAQLPLAEVKEQIQNGLKEQKSRELAAAKGVELVNALESGSTLGALAEAEQLEVTTKEALSRRARDLDPSIITQAFRMPAPEGAANYTTLSLRSGDQVVLALDAVNQITGEFNEANAKTLSSSYGLREVEAYFAALEKNSSVSIVEENLAVTVGP